MDTKNAPQHDDDEYAILADLCIQLVHQDILRHQEILRVPEEQQMRAWYAQKSHDERRFLTKVHPQIMYFVEHQNEASGMFTRSQFYDRSFISSKSLRNSPRHESFLPRMACLRPCAWVSMVRWLCVRVRAAPVSVHGLRASFAPETLSESAETAR